MADKDSKSIIESVGKELKANPPAILASTRRKFGVKDSQKQRVAILLSKARKAGADVPPPRSTSLRSKA